MDHRGERDVSRVVRRRQPAIGANTIDGDVRIKNDVITIAGQTAPGSGITITGNLGIDANDVVIRYIRVRTHHEAGAVGARYRRNIILDRVSASWSIDIAKP